MEASFAVLAGAGRGAGSSQRALAILLLLLLLLAAVGPLCAEEPLIVAHRGASQDAPENTLPAFELAWERGADAIEVDCHLTSDGHIVCFHDRDAKKLTGHPAVVAESTLEELRGLDVGSHHSEAFRGTPMPTLAEVLATVPDGRKIYIEVKCGASIVPSLLEQVAASGLGQEQVVFICFQQEVIAALEKAQPAYRSFWLTQFKQDKKSGKVVPARKAVLETLARIEADGISSSRHFVTRELVDAIRAGGYEYHVWTINDGAAARQLRDCGVLSITTDIPGRLREELAGQR